MIQDFNIFRVMIYNYKLEVNEENLSFIGIIPTFEEKDSVVPLSLMAFENALKH